MNDDRTTFADDERTTIPNALHGSSDERTTLPDATSNARTTSPARDFSGESYGDMAADERTMLPAAAALETPSQPPVVDETPILPLAMDVATSRFEIGDLILGGKYRVRIPVDGGAEASAYIGERVADQARVFIKHQHRRNTEARTVLLEKLRNECRHDGLVQLLENQGGKRPIEVYEWLDGESLERVIERKQRFTDAEIASFTRQLAAAIHYLHSEVRVAHRDVKPANIQVVPGPVSARYVLLDYGVMTSNHDGTTTVAGTPKYQPPESLMQFVERAQLEPTDWWCLGRIVQELVDGIHPYDRIRQALPGGGIAEETVMAGAWRKILYEVNVTENGRAGQVQPTNERWTPLLRGLLTTDFAKRWGYAEVVRFLDGERVPDAYDAAGSGRIRGVQDDEGDELINDVRRLSRAEHWREAVSSILGNRGVYRVARKDEENKRLRTRLDAADAVYADLKKKNFANDVLEDVFTMLVLKAIGGNDVPFSLAGYSLDRVTLLDRVQGGTDIDHDLLAALSQETVLAVIRDFDGAAGAELTDFAKGWLAVRSLLLSWGVNESGARFYAAMAIFANEPQETNEATIRKASALLSHTTNEPINAVFRKKQRTPAESAAMVFVLAAPQNWGFVTIESVEKAKMGATAARAQALAYARGWMVLGKFNHSSGLILEPWSPIAFAALALVPMTLVTSPGALFALATLLTFPIILLATWNHAPPIVRNVLIVASLGSLVSGISFMSLFGDSVLGFQFFGLLGGSAIFFFTRKQFVDELRTFHGAQTGGGWFKGRPDAVALHKQVTALLPGKIGTIVEVEAELATVNAKLRGAENTWGFAPQELVSREGVDAAHRRFWLLFAGVCVLSLAAGIVIDAFTLLGHVLFGGKAAK